jgi:hypothetical protein
MITRERELWAMALWVETHHRDAGAAFIAERIAHLALEGEHGGVVLWRKVADRYAALSFRD